MAGPSDTISFEQHGLDRRTINGPLSGSRNATMLTLIGAPCGTYGEDCRHPTNSRIAQMMETADFGPFRAMGLRPAVATLKAVMVDIEAEKPAIHSSLTTAGMLCCRLVRGSATAISNHSWGTAIDLKIDGRLDTRGDNRTQKGLLEIAPIFNRHKFFWGAAFPTEDSMHFEASEQLIHQWAAEGEFGAVPKADVIGEITLATAVGRLRNSKRYSTSRLASMSISMGFSARTRALLSWSFSGKMASLLMVWWARTRSWR